MDPAQLSKRGWESFRGFDGVSLGEPTPLSSLCFSPQMGGFNKFTAPPLAPACIMEELFGALFKDWTHRGLVRQGSFNNSRISLSLIQLRDLLDESRQTAALTDASIMLLPYLRDHLGAFYEYWLKVWDQEIPIAQLIVANSESVEQTRYFHQDGGWALICHLVGKECGTRFALNGIDQSKLLPGLALRDHRFTRFEEFVLPEGRTEILKPGDFAVFDGNVPHAATPVEDSGGLRAAFLLGVASSRCIDPETHMRLLMELYERLHRIRTEYGKG